MGEQDRYRGRTAQSERVNDNEWQRDYGQRHQRYDSASRALPNHPDYSRDNGIERDLRGNDYPRDDGYARDDRFPLDFGSSEARDFRGQARDYGDANRERGWYSQPDPRRQLENFGSRMRGQPNRPAGLQAASFYGRGPKGYTRSDERIREDVCQRLSDNDEVDASDIEVTVREREVTLEGSVETRRMKRLSEDIADSVTGVDDVHNRIKVRKAFLRDVADTVLGNDAAEHHAHSGTKTVSPTSSAALASSNTTRAANGHT